LAAPTLRQPETADLMRTEMTGQLEGRRILVSGAASGIGAAAVGVFAAEGATVTATFRETAPPDRAASLANWVHCDFRRESAAERCVSEAASHMGGLDVLLHAAGSWQAAAPGDVSEAHLEAMLSTNVKATVYANQAAFRHMREAGGRIINFGSSEGVTGTPFSAGYATAKGAVHSWTRSAPQGLG
jgi:NAD(P)-dependent dehydrogenase (short-subunit alcohol dehydrogenase family)